MRTLIIAGMTLIFSTSFASAGSFTVTTTAEQDAQLAALKMTPQQIVTKRLDDAVAADTNRKLALLRQECAKKVQAACDKIAAATKGVK
jgi:hypothetical protein